MSMVGRCICAHVRTAGCTRRSLLSLAVAPAAGAGVRVLVVEDSRTLADALAEGLRDEGMAVDVAYDGLQAATRIELNPYEVVVLGSLPTRACTATPSAA